MNVVAEPFEKPDGEDEVMALAESRGWPTIRGLVGGGDGGLHWRRRIRWFTPSQLQEARTLLTEGKPPLVLRAADLPAWTEMTHNLKGAPDELVAEGPGSTEAQRDTAATPRADGGGEACPAEARGNGTAGAPDPVAATPASWAYEARQAYLVRVLKFVPFLADALASGGIETTKNGEPFTISGPLWIGTYDSNGLPIPAENPAWLHEVWPVYNGPEPELNKMRSLRDTLILRPDAGPHLVSAGLWTGEYDAQGLPIPTPDPIDNRRRR